MPHRCAFEFEECMAREVAQNSNHGRSIANILNIIALAVNLFCAVDQVATAFQSYRGWQLELMKTDPRLAGGRTLLLSDHSNDPERNPAEIDTSLIESEEPGRVKKGAAH
jgi:hypothetical protein